MEDTEKTEVTTALQAVIANQTGRVNVGQLYRKIDFRIIPLMFLCYFYQFLDKVRSEGARKGH